MVNKQALNLLFVANTISGISQGISMIAIPWYFCIILGYQKEFGIFYSIVTLGSVFWSVYAGVLIDTYNRKLILLIQSILGVVVLSLASFLSYYQMMPIWLISGIVFAFTIYVYNIHFSNIYSLAQEMTDAHNYSRVITQLEVQTQSTSILGGVCAAMLLEGSQSGVLTFFGFEFATLWRFDRWELWQIFGLDALTYIIGLAIIYQIKFTPIVERKLVTESAYNRLITGWNYLKDKPSLLILGWMSSAVFVCVILVSQFLISPYVFHFLGKGASVFASSEFYFAIGAIVAGITARYLLPSYNEVIRILMMFLLGILVFIIFSYNTHLGIFYLANIIFGYSNAAIRFYRVSFLWRIISNDMMGRVTSIFGLSSYLLRAIWGFIFSASFFGGRDGIQWVMIILLGYIVLSGWIIYLYRKDILKYSA